MSSDEEVPMGPVEVLVVEFPGHRFTGDIARRSRSSRMPAW
jgi:hypothetical protein